MSEWPKVCTSYRHQWKGIPATGSYMTVGGWRIWYCQDCAIDFGLARRAEGFKWEPLREPSPAPPTSEREQP